MFREKNACLCTHLPASIKQGCAFFTMAGGIFSDSAKGHGNVSAEYINDADCGRMANRVVKAVGYSADKRVGKEPFALPQQNAARQSRPGTKGPLCKINKSD